MANFCILRTRKLKTVGNVAASIKHSLRERVTLNADPAMRGHNIASDKTTEQAMKKFRSRLPEKIRKNGVVCIEYLITASPEAMAKMTKEQQTKYFQKSLDFICGLHGSHNVFSFGLHRDEKTPHLYIYAVPIDTRGKLNARAFLGGRDKLQHLQDMFFDEVGKSAGLERGVKGSKAKHQDIKKFYELQRVSNFAPKIEVQHPPKKGRLMLDIDQWADYQTDRINRALETYHKGMEAQKNQTRIEKSNYEFYRAENQELKQKIDNFNNLTADQLLEKAHLKRKKELQRGRENSRFERGLD